MEASLVSRVRTGHQSSSAVEAPYISVASTGVACFALAWLAKLGVLDQIRSQGFLCLPLSTPQLSVSNLPGVESALEAMAQAGLLIRTGNVYRPTESGTDVLEHSGLISMLIEGYGTLALEQIRRPTALIHKPWEYIDEGALASSSERFRSPDLNRLILDTIAAQRPQAGLCDLGCGNGSLLLAACRETGLPGLGIEMGAAMVQIARENIKSDLSDPQVAIVEDDLACPSSPWPNIDLIIQSFALHDVGDEEAHLSALAGIREAFPNARRLISVDLVRTSPGHTAHMPGYDFVHGLQGFRPLTYPAVTTIYKKAGMNILQERTCDLPNVYVWTLCLD